MLTFDRRFWAWVNFSDTVAFIYSHRVIMAQSENLLDIIAFGKCIVPPIN